MTSGAAFTRQPHERPWQPMRPPTVQEHPYPIIEGAKEPLKRLMDGKSRNEESDLRKVFNNLQWPQMALAVRQSCRYESERKVSMALTEVGIPHLYEPCRVRLVQDKYTRYCYRMDFVTPYFIDGRRVYIETHGMEEDNGKRTFFPEDLEKYQTLFSNHGDRWYGILRTDATERDIEEMKSGCRIRIKKIADEIWRPVSKDKAVEDLHLRLMLAGLKIRATRRVAEEVETPEPTMAMSPMVPRMVAPRRELDVGAFVRHDPFDMGGPTPSL